MVVITSPKSNVSNVILFLTFAKVFPLKLNTPRAIPLSNVTPLIVPNVPLTFPNVPIFVNVVPPEYDKAFAAS